MHHRSLNAPFPGSPSQRARLVQRVAMPRCAPGSVDSGYPNRTSPRLQPFRESIMRLTKFLLSGATALAAVGLAPDASANGRNPGSLLLFPEFDNRTNNGHLTLLTVTNTNTGVGNPGNADGTIKVEFIYIGKYGSNSQELNCLEFNRTETLTANDTISVLTNVHNPQHEQGFVYAFAKDKTTNKAISFNWLIGNVLTLESITQVEYSMNPVAFKAIPAQGANTDIDNGGNGDGVRDLDGVEYEPVPEEILIPRFIGTGGPYDSELILIGLSGGKAFETITDFLVYNDNEEVFSAQYKFRCWDRVYLNDINNLFTQDFLKTTGHAANEIIGASQVESGWIRVFGNSAFSTAEAIIDPAIYAVLVERIGNVGAADLPFESVATQANGDLFPVGLFGDPSGNNSDNQ
jgi:hypothetical protein